MREIKQLPTTNNLINLSEEELIKLANDKHNGVVDALIKACWETKACGDALRELKNRLDGKSNGGRGNKKGGFADLFCVNSTQNKLYMSRWQAYKYISVSDNWSQIESNLDNAKIRNGRVSPTALLKSIEKVEAETEVPDLPAQIKTVETKTDTSHLVPKAELEKANQKIKQLENQPPQQITVLDDSSTKELEKSKKIINELQQQLSNVAQQKPQVIEKVVEKIVEVREPLNDEFLESDIQLRNEIANLEKQLKETKNSVEEKADKLYEEKLNSVRLNKDDTPEIFAKRMLRDSLDSPVKMLWRLYNENSILSEDRQTIRKVIDQLTNLI